MTLIEQLADANGVIVLLPGMCDAEGERAAHAEPEWFATQFPVLAQASVPLTAEQYAQLRAIDRFWAQNAERWRAEGRI